MSDQIDPPEKRKRGQPTILTDEVIDIIASYVRQGCYIETAVAAAGAVRQSFYDWMKFGRERPDSIYGKFVEAMDKAIAEAEVKDVLRITAATKKHWQAAAWRLERRFPDRWGKKEKLDVNANQTIRYVTRIAEDGAVIRREVKGDGSPEDHPPFAADETDGEEGF